MVFIYKQIYFKIVMLKVGQKCSFYYTNFHFGARTKLLKLSSFLY